MSYIDKATVASPNGYHTGVPFLSRQTELHQQRLLQMNSELLSLSSSRDHFRNPRDDLPPKAICDQSMARYFETFGTVFRIVEWAELREQYESFWTLPDEQIRCENAVMLCLVLAIGNGMLPPGQGRLPRSDVLRLLGVAKAWKAAIAEVESYSLWLLRVDFLLLLARLVHCTGPPSDAVASANLVRSAMAISLHKEPAEAVAASLSAHDRERRRRIWYAVLELDVRYALDAGMQPIYLGEWESLPPQPDETVPMVIETGEEEIQNPWLLENLRVQQTALDRSLPLRMKIAHWLNKPRFDADHALAQDLTSQLSNMMASPSSTASSFSSSSSSSFLEAYVRLVYQRTLLAVHCPFALTDSHLKSYSQNICLSTALSIVSHFCCVDENSPQTADHPFPYGACPLVILVQTNSSFFQNDILPAALYLCSQLIGSLSASVALDPANLVAHIPALQTNLVTAIDGFVALAERRVAATDHSEVAYVLPAASMAYYRWERGVQHDCSGAQTETVQQIVDRIAQACVVLMEGRGSL
ncbi:hypothetical protein ASPZODRAFT_136759 [Penicilliopsis zonata CBS 506.65]|uniref:Xylanolytic transcriptional activator regulatory domain-containing protein n=1 Tax=Penicilliopsis zonata CBS 506.65 TaxID=1073090 RepID=A0A1L9S6X2_9EURO|nr:hypothetical protein ASPZODRAFT_136759 [Penicilliopsis zonata CBS 506.65]OJJ42902.1 hypothetical protein ASPZODRAFT_136759 [Penicilliopsis zonata CBS 506.65]